MLFVAQVLLAVLMVFLGLMFVRLVVDWVQIFARRWEPRGPLLVVLEACTPPPTRRSRRSVGTCRRSGSDRWRSTSAS